MTPSELARVLRARRIGKGKWMARCPAHKERTGSLSVTDMGQGHTRLHCFAGCPQRAVLDALGLSWRDLKPEYQSDRGVLRKIKEDQAREKAEKEHRKNVLGLAILRVRWWDRRIQRLGRSLMRTPENDFLAAEFHRALRYQRRCEHLWRSL